MMKTPNVNRRILDTLFGDPLRRRAGTHGHVIGSSGFGKTKFLESIFRSALEDPRQPGICIIDWGGELYGDLVNYLSYVRPRRDVILLNPSAPDFVTPYNPFINGGEDAGTTVSRRIKLTIRPFEQKDTNVTVRLERVCRILFSFAIAAGETLPNAVELLSYNDEEVYRYALSVLDRPEFRTAHRHLQELGNLSTFASWYTQIESTDNRLTRFIGPLGVRRFIGMKEGNLDIEKVLDRNAILLVNLQHSDYLEDDAARLFAACLLSDFFDAARKRPGTRKRYLLFLDEFQEYMSLDLARMLDLVRKDGLHLLMAHQHLGHLADDAHLLKSVTSNAQVKVIFGGLDYEDAVTMAHEVFLDRINEHEVLETITSQQPDGIELRVLPTFSQTEGRSSMRSRGSGSTEVDTTSESRGENEGGAETESRTEYDNGEESKAVGRAFTLITNRNHSTGLARSTGKSSNESDAQGTASSQTVGMTYLQVQKYKTVKTGEISRGREDRIGKYAAMLKYQQQQHCFVRIKAQPCFEHEVPTVKSYVVSPSSHAAFLDRVHASSGALPAETADRLIAQSRDEFFARVHEVTRAARRRNTNPPASSGSTPTRTPF